MADSLNTFGGQGYQSSMDAEERNRRIAEQKARDAQAREDEKMRGPNNQEDLLYRYGTGTSGFLAASDKYNLTDQQKDAWSQDLLKKSLSQSGQTYSVQSTPRMYDAIKGSQDIRRQEGTMPGVQSTEDMLKAVSGPNTPVPDLGSMRTGGTSTPVQSRYGELTYGDPLNNYMKDYYDKINQGISIDGNEFTGTKIVYGNEEKLAQLENDIKLVQNQAGLSERDKKRALERLNKEYDQVRAQGVAQETPEYKKWKEQQTIAAQKLYGEAMRNTSENQYGTETTPENINPFAMNQPTQPGQTQSYMEGSMTGLGQPSQAPSMDMYGESASPRMGETAQVGSQAPVINPYTGEPVQGGMGQVGGGVAGQGGYMGQYAQDVNNVLSSQLATAKESMDMGMSLAQSEYEAKNQGLRNKMLLGLQNSNALAKMRSRGYDPDTMTTQEIIDFVAQEGVDISDSDRQLIQARGAAAVDSLMAAKNDDFARLDVERSKMEREFNRALYETEQMNMANDNAVKKMVARFGGGKVESLATNMEIVRATERGQMMKNDLLGQYTDNKTLLAIEANKMSRFYTENINNIQMEMASMENDMRTQLIDKLDGFIDQNITNEADLMKAMKPEIQNFLKTQGELKTRAFEMINEENARFEDMQLKIREQQRQEDKFMSEQYGFLFRNGQPVVDANGFQVPTMDNMKFQNQLDQQLTEQTGYLYQNGQQVLDSRGNPIQTFGREKFLTQEARYAQEFAADQYWNQMDYNQAQERINLAKDQFNIDNAMAAFDMQMSLGEIGWEKGRIDPQTGLIRTNQGIFNTDGSKYQPYVEGDAVRFKTQTDENGAIQLWDKAREQCGEFVNDIIGKKIFGDSIQQKMTKITTKIPQMGAAFIQATQGPYGHVGMVEKVNYNESGVPVSMEILDSNYRSAGKPERAVIDISYVNGQAKYTRNGKNVDIKGFTDSVLGTTDEVKGKFDQAAQQEFMQDPFGQVYARGPQGTSEIVQEFAEMTEEQRRVKRNEALKGGDLRSALGSTIYGKDLTQGQVEKLDQAQTVLSQLQKLDETLASVDTGPITGLFRNKNPYDVEAADVKAQIIRLVPSLARGTFGEVGVLTDNDISRYASTIPNMGTPAGARQLLMEATRDLVADGMKRTLKTMAAGGSDVSGYEYILDDLEALEQQMAPSASLSQRFATQGIQQGFAQNPMMMIVQDKATGQIGRIPSNEYDATKYTIYNQ